MVVLDYNIVLRDQTQGIKRNSQTLGFVFSSFGKLISSFISLDSVISRINKGTTTQLLQNKGILAQLNENFQKLEGKELTMLINSLNALLKKNISLHAVVVKILEEDKGNLYPKLNISKEALEETIETLYTITLLLKRANLKKPIETSPLAIDSSQKSLDTLAKVIYSSND